MLKVCIIDDEIAILENLRLLIDWPSLNLELCQTFSTAQELLNYLPLHHIDILISDICMPNLSGLDLGAIIKKNYPHVKLMLLTAHEKFEYAKRAIDIGINSFLLKPLDINQIQNELIKIRKELDDLETQTALNQQAVKENFISWLVSCRQILDEKDIENRFNFYKIPVQSKFFQVVSLNLHPLSFDTPTQQAFYLLAMKDIILSIFNDLCSCTLFQTENNSLNILISYPSNQDSIFYIDLACEYLAEQLTEQLHLCPMIGYGNKYFGYSQIHKSYYEAIYASTYITKDSSATVSSYHHLTTTHLTTYTDNKLRTDLLSFMRQRDSKRLLESIKKNLSLQIQPSTTYENLQLLCIDYLITGIIFINQNKLNLCDLFCDDFDALTAIRKIDTLEKALTFFNYYFTQIITFLLENNIHTANTTIKACLHYIHANLSSPDLSVKNMARSLFVSEDYLGKLFKKEMGINLIKYIIKLRMEEAERLLHVGDLSIQEIALQLGFNDALYFSKCFKKYFGSAPTQYYQTLDK